MPALRIATGLLWIVFWLYWLISAAGAKEGSRARPVRPLAILIIALGFLLLRVLKVGAVVVRSPFVQAIGVILLLLGLALAVWARIYLGRNWGMPRTLKNEPELVTSGPYTLVRHPIYSGLLLAILGTSLAVDLELLIVFGVSAVYFIYSARVEERLLIATFPTTYPRYKSSSKMLIPFVL